MTATTENRPEWVGEIVRYARKNPVMIAAFVIPSLVTASLPYAMPKIGEILASTPPGRAWNESTERAAQIRKAELQVKQDALIADFKRTDGVDRTQVAQESWLVTITRPSSVLGGSQQEILGRVTKRIADETGCKAVE